MANTTGQKFGGRSKGTPNKTTNEIREFYKLLIDDNLEQIKTDLNTLDPKERLKMILELSKFVIPTLKAIEMETKVDINERNRVNIHFTNKR
jgi:dsRNA-specific ribonuclease